MELPPAEAEAAELRDCYAPAMHWADVFWGSCLQRCARMHPRQLPMHGPVHNAAAHCSMNTQRGDWDA